MDDFVKLKPDERRIFFEGTATPRNVQAQIVEKDFWVCWTLKELFQLHAIGEHLIFKGGTSLSKVFQAIERFSEDIDVSIEPRLSRFRRCKRARGGREQQGETAAH